MRTEVLHLTRNIKIKSATSYGGRVYASETIYEVTNSKGEVTKTIPGRATLNLEGVEMSGMG